MGQGWIAVVSWYLGCLFVMKAGVRVYLWCQVSKGKTKITLERWDALNEAIITLLYLQKGTTSGVIVLCRCCMCPHTHLNIIQHELHASCVMPFHISKCFLLLIKPIFWFITKRLIWLKAFELARCCTNPKLHSPHHQTATKGVTALCQPLSPTTRPMTATLEAPTTAPTEAAVVPLVRGLGP